MIPIAYAIHWSDAISVAASVQPKLFMLMIIFSETQRMIIADKQQ